MPSVALPRVKARRRRKRPLSPSGRWFLLNLVWDGAFIAYDAVRVASAGLTVLLMVCLPIQCVLFAYFWPQFWREWKRRDDE